MGIHPSMIRWIPMKSTLRLFCNLNVAKGTHAVCKRLVRSLDLTSNHLAEAVLEFSILSVRICQFDQPLKIGLKDLAVHASVIFVDTQSFTANCDELVSDHFCTTIKVWQPSQRHRCPKNTNELGRWQGLPAPTLFSFFRNYEPLLTEKRT
jgi:hypothetical protein